MASPHVVGLLAYLLSIYGTDEFHTVENAIPMGFKSVSTPVMTSNSLSSSLPMAYSLFNSVLSYFQPATQQVQQINFSEASPDIISVLHPSDMKKAMIKLSTSGALTDLDNDTVNKLIFNNATKDSP